MQCTVAQTEDRNALELFYRPLRDDGRGMSFPCNAIGIVDLDGLSERERRAYLYARVVAGNEFAWPVVRPSAVH